jgi:hypothetical protein
MTAIRGRFVWRAGAAILAAAAMACAALPGGGAAADKGDPPAKGEPPPELAFVPGDGGAFLTVRWADVWNHEVAKAAREKILKEWPDAFKDSAKALGVAPEEVERFTMVAPVAGPGPQGEPFVAVTTRKPCDQKKVLAAAVPDAKEEKVKDRSLFSTTSGQAAVFLDDRTYLLGSPDSLKAFLERPGDKKDGALTPGLRLAGEKHAVVAALDVAALSKAIPPVPPGAPEPPELKAMRPFLKAQRAELFIDLGGQARGTLRLTFANETDARDAEKAFGVGKQTLVPLLAEARKTLEKQEDMRPVTSLLTDVQAGLNAAKAERDGSVLEATMVVKIDAKVAPEALAMAAVAARRQQSANNLKQLALALHNYDSAIGHLPPQAICDKSGKPLLSWRVEVLPYVEADNLYREFRRDEPWDSDHNKKLIEKMPKVFALADSEAEKAHETHYQGFAGPGAVFDGKTGIKITDVTDGTSNTILLVEAAKPVPWTKPEDVPFDNGKLGPRVGGVFQDGFHAAMCDGSVRFFALPVKSEETLRAAVTRAGGEVIDLGKLSK